MKARPFSSCTTFSALSLSYMAEARMKCSTFVMNTSMGPTPSNLGHAFDSMSTLELPANARGKLAWGGCIGYGAL